MDQSHRPVMLAEVVRVLNPRPGGLYADGTLGAAGHAEAVLTAGGPDTRLLGLDRDPRALSLARERLAGFGDRVRLVQATFDHMDQELSRWGRGPADGVLLDLGVSSMQLDEAGRGFSFRRDEPLDMRMGGDGPSAAELVASLDQGELASLFRRLGEESLAKRIAGALVRAREQEPIATTGRLAGLVEQAMPAAERRKRKVHPATKIFQALRLAVNDELGMLERFLDQAPGLLAPGGRLAVLSYHSLEDRRVKRAISAWADPCTCPKEIAVCLCGKKPLFKPLGKLGRPGEAEVEANPRARSARLRAAVRTEAPA
ncbi:MAG: 16S rRNA (cytosine(1402)-N(4))-methyltransferase RsmH [Desulfarculaceae bacterium]|nr:16S rRNA (cytosine(1402)-N(4))-methyltransferase RsmH [Desulfarculaceae bacterium]MCF8070899.1 16S rRNA (cytosine(1402)-N(4))-methyltransferase RsmH [Desulfarculaceae bacterium]MCF8100487.1 16S rRNA (cytosine(1402)-N(4))-methyltransferase RsmH [Desulfarculaceae bacterium]MCF8118094.1 16S rRNA (cytosine(1402)-N(4))-methyltransferase RsmH [Desulfarculaceae bacterium]